MSNVYNEKKDYIAMKQYINSNFNDKHIYEKFDNVFNDRNSIYNSSDREILVIGEFNLLKKRMDKNIYNFYNYLKNNSSYKLIFIDRNTENFVVNSSIFDVIEHFCSTKNPIVLSLVYDNPDKSLVSNLDLYNNIKIFDIEDCYNIEGLVSVINKYKYTHVLYKYNCIQQNYIINQFPNIQFIHFPHYIDNTIFYKNNNVKKDIDVLLYGNTSSFYPFRNKLLEILSDNKLFNFKYLEFPGFGDIEECKYNPIIGKELSSYINRAKITICTCSMFNYFIKKYIEIPMSGSVLCGNYPNTEKQIYQDNIILLDDNWDKETILNHINMYLKQSDKLNIMKENSYIISQNYTYLKGLQHFNNIIKNITN